jgi:hypothetical protein
MFFACSVRSVGNKWLHFFAAAMAADTGILDVGDDVAAMLAFVECHGILLLHDTDQ